MSLVSFMSLEMPRATWVSPGFSRSKPLFPDVGKFFFYLFRLLLMLTIVFNVYLSLDVPEGLGKVASTIMGPNNSIRVVWVVLFIYLLQYK